MRTHSMDCNVNARNLGFLSLVCMLACVSGGCTSIRSDMTPGKMEWIQPTSDAPRVGQAYLMRGWIGVFSGGIDALTVKIDRAGVRAHVFQEDQVNLIAQTLAKKYSEAGSDHEPIILIGHSLGADDVITEARELDKVGVPVDLLVTIDATRPSKVPKNVKICYNYYQPSFLDVLGVFRGVPLEAEPGFTGKLYNMNVRKDYKELLEPDTNHVNIDKNTKIHADIIAKLMPVCPPRREWVAARAAGHMPALAGAKLGPTTPPAAPPTATILRVPAASAATPARDPNATTAAR